MWEQNHLILLEKWAKNSCNEEKEKKKYSFIHLLDTAKSSRLK